MKKTAMILGLVLLTACQSLTRIDQSQLWAEQTGKGAGTTGGFLPAVQFLGPDLMQSELHSVYPQAWNNGYANIYRIKTPEHVFVVQGTDNARKRIHEIWAIEQLRGKSTVEAFGDTVSKRSLNLVETPIRAVVGGIDRGREVETARQAMLVVPSGISDVALGLFGGIKELGVTGVRLVRGATGTKCAGIRGCVTTTGKQVWSGVNSITGKHAAVRFAHYTVGTDPYSENKALQREINRIAYTEAFTGLGFKYGIIWSKTRFLSDYTKDVGYYNNAEFISQYQDADREKNREKADMISWGADPALVDRFYANKAFTPLTKKQFYHSLTRISNPAYRVYLLNGAVKAQTRFVAENKIRIANYISDMEMKDEFSGFVDNITTTMTIKPDRTLVLPLVADYLGWTDEIAVLVNALAALTGPGKQAPRAEIHVLGQVSPALRMHAQRLGLAVREIPPS